MTVSILLAQSGKPIGSAGVARDDFDVGVAVQATAVGGPFSEYVWTFVSKAIDIEAGVQATSAFTAPSSPSTDIDPVDVSGEYLIQVAVDSGDGLGANETDVARIVFYAGDLTGLHGPLNTDPAELPQRMPAFREQLEDNVADAVQPTGNTEGWSRPWLKLKAIVDRIYQGKSWSWARVTGATAARPSSFNVDDVVNTGTGLFTVTFERALPNDTYAVVASPMTTPGMVVASNLSTTGFDVERDDPSGTPVDEDFVFDVRVEP